MPYISFSEKKYVIVLLSISDAKKKSCYSPVHIVVFVHVFFSYTVLCAAVSLWLPHSGTYQNILTVRPEQNLKSYKLDKIRQLNGMKINQTLVYNCLISNARISTNNTRFPRTNLTQTHACAEQK